MSEVLKDFSANIDLKETLVFEPIKVVEGDNGNVLVLKIVKDGEPVDLTDCLVQIVFAHSGRTVWQDSSSPDGGITISGDDNNIVTVRLHSDSYAPNGITVCQVKVYSGAGQTTLVSSARFSFKAELSLLNAETVESIEQYSILVTLIETVNSVLDDSQPDWDETNVLLKPYIKNKPVIGTDIQSPTNALTVDYAPSGTDELPGYRPMVGHRKFTLASILGYIRAQLDSYFAPITHKSRHAAGGADALTADDIGAVSVNSSMRNLVINANFAINQDNLVGTVVLAANAHGHDGWRAGTNGCTYTFAKAENRTTLTITAGSLLQNVDGNNLKSGAVCLSWGGTAQGRIGTSGAYAASPVVGSAVGGTNLTVEFGTGTLHSVQLNYGEKQIAFTPIPEKEDLLVCRERYIPGIGEYRGGVIADGNAYVLIPLVRPMRATPNLTLMVPDSVIYNGDTFKNISNIVSFQVTGDGIKVRLGLASPAVSGYYSCFTVGTSIKIDARI